MPSLMRRAKPDAASRADPAPSRWAWRIERMMLTPGIRLSIRAGIPFVLTFVLGTAWLTNEERREAIRTVVADARASVENRPEFMVSLMSINGATPEIQRDVRAVVPLDFPVSSFDLDLNAIRETIAGLPPVQQASVRIRPGGVLLVDITPRVPVAIWRTAEGLTLIDAAGASVAPLSRRDARPDLPVIAGQGANDHVTEALDLIRAAAPLGARLRGVVRMGERRWDVVLNRGQRVLLPSGEPRRALERVIALESAQEVLSRDVARVDMRLAERPTLQMNASATQEWWRIRTLADK